MVVAVVVFVVVGFVVVVVEEKDEPDAASVSPGEKKAGATKVACEVIGSGSKEVKDPAESVLVLTKEGANKVEVEEPKKKSEEVGVIAESKQVESTPAPHKKSRQRSVPLVPPHHNLQSDSPRSLIAARNTMADIY